MGNKSTLHSVTQSLYDRYVRAHIPRVYGNYGGIAARDCRLLDFNKTFPDYKTGLIEAIEHHINPGDIVTLVGAGRGVSSVRIAQQGATVHAYEAAKQMIPVAKETVETAGFSDQLIFYYATVGEAIDVYGSEFGPSLEPRLLGTNDVLVMDCEGAELSILKGLGSYPETVLVETHPEKGVSTKSVYVALRERGYDVVSNPYNSDSEHKQVLEAVK